MRFYDLGSSGVLLGKSASDRLERRTPSRGVEPVSLVARPIPHGPAREPVDAQESTNAFTENTGVAEPTDLRSMDIRSTTRTILLLNAFDHVLEGTDDSSSEAGIGERTL